MRPCQKERRLKEQRSPGLKIKFLKRLGGERNADAYKYIRDLTKQKS